MVNIGRLTTLATLGLTPLSYKPRPQSSKADVAQLDRSAAGSTVTDDVQAIQRFNTTALNKDNASKPKHGHKTTASHPQPTQDSGVSSKDSDSCHVDPYDASEISDQTFPSFDEEKAKFYRYRQQRSVNLGSWFVHEKWMTPSLYTCAADTQASELDIAKGWGSHDNARHVLEKHWDTWYTTSGYDYLSSIGINTVRLPIGFWSLGPNYCMDTPFEEVGEVYKNSWPRVVRAINQAGHAGLGVLIDLHGAPGSQNGEQHSGVSDGKVEFFNKQEYQDKTVEVLKHLAKGLAGVNNVVGIQILNEPRYDGKLVEFYEHAIGEMPKVSTEAEKLPLYLHDGFDLDRMSNELVSKHEDFIVQDHHSYFVFTEGDRKEKASQHIVDVEGAIHESLQKASDRQGRNLIVGEWSCALAPESLEDDGSADDLRKKFCEGQMEVYDNVTAGWSFWSYKKEDCDNDPGWCFRAAVGKALPSNFTPETGGSKMYALQELSRTSDDAQPNVRSRFDAIHQRRTTGSGPFHPLEDQEDLSSKPKGYQDGYGTAKAFAEFNGSKLGFIGQYLRDHAAQPSKSSSSSQGKSWGKRDMSQEDEEYEKEFKNSLQGAEKMLFQRLSR